MKTKLIKQLALPFILASTSFAVSLNAQSFISRKGYTFYSDSKPYYFVGANYWYGSLLGLEKDKKRGVDRLRRELDFLKSKGVTNLRLMAGGGRLGPDQWRNAGRAAAAAGAGEV